MEDSGAELVHSGGTEDKKTGSFYTPSWCIDIMLEMSGFSDLTPADMINTSVIDPACGDGAILCRILERFVPKMIESGVEVDAIEKWVESSVVGVEVDFVEADKCSANIKKVMSESGIFLANPCVICADAFEFFRGNSNRYDFVIGNPPYVRIHNMDEKPDSDYIDGMCDIYYAFFDIGQRMLAGNGTLCFISPSSWFQCKAGAKMRKHLEETGRISDVLDFGHFQVFNNATTYTAITVLKEKGGVGDVRLWSFDEGSAAASVSSRVKNHDAWYESRFFPDGLSSTMKDIISFDNENPSVFVKNGYATMCDAVYISENGIPGCSEIEIDVVKASKGKRLKAIYPYHKNGEIMSLQKIRALSKSAFDHLTQNKNRLLERNRIDEECWWGYGRSQGIADTFKDKVAIQSIVRPGKEVVVRSAPFGIGVYGGIYVIRMGEHEVKEALNSPSFFEYAQSVGKYKSGGYYALSGKEIEKYLRWYDSFGFGKQKE